MPAETETPAGEDVRLTDHQTAEAIRDGTLGSPQKYGDFWLFDLRITGTGVAYRDSIDEYAVRDPEKWLSPEFVERCNGLAVIFGHPERSGLNHEEFQQRAIGSIILPYVKGDEVWGIAKIFDADAALLMQTTHRSTSPGVTPPAGSTPIVLENGTKVLDEGLPLVLDHLAVCEAGVWDKDGPPEGVRLDSLAAKEQPVTEEERKKLEEERDDARRRADAAEAELKSRDDKAKKDAEESEAADKAKADAKRDSRKDRHSKHDGDVMDCARCDSEEEAEEKEREDKKRKDSAPKDNVDADQIKELQDARRADSATIKQLQEELAQVKRGQEPLSIEDRNEIAKAFHRADTLFQMLGETTPQVLPGEKPLAYRRRLAAGLRNYSEKWKTYTIHDSLDAHAFELIENSIYSDALETAKNPTINDSKGRLREVVQNKHGKTVVEFYGDSRAAWEPFMPPMRNFITKFDNAPGRR